jgi:peptidoglycan/LPS O-acetylase OafA/YrhL
MSTPRLAFITWMKAAGMLLIVYGHAAAALPGATLRPINTKQLGVAFFVFITGVTLARDVRAPVEIVVRRLFEMVVLAAALALAISLAGLLIDGNLRESNYLPFLLGANVLFDNFPANPTTWYVGTYAHLIVLAAFVHKRWLPSWRDVAILAVLEVAIRSWLLARGLTFVPYALLTNWLTVYCLGSLWGRGDRLVRQPTSALAILVITAGAYSLLPVLVEEFPFYLPESPSAGQLLLTSAVVTLLYTSAALTSAQVFSFAGERVPAIIQWIADHTLVIFLAHMPVYYVLLPIAQRNLGEWRVLVLLVACVVVPAALSMAVRRLVDLQRLREQLVSRLAQRSLAA